MQHILFPPLSDEARRALDALPAALDATSPLKAAHRRDLPDAVGELSLRLTSERGGGELPYWSAPRLASAYLRYFLPWNLVRLTRLLQALDLPEFGPEERLALDLGSGPLTLPLALWLARPELRDTALEFVCADIAPKALELGGKIFAHVTGKDCAWRVIPMRASFAEALKRLRGRPRLICAANALNEAKTGRNAPRDELAGTLAERAARLLGPGGALLCVEPGTRLGGKLVQGLRARALDAGLAPVQPCPHAGPCPMEGGRGWCHFSFDAQGAPEWLTRLSREAELAKKDLSLSFALLQQGGRKPAGGPRARVLSAPFEVPGIARAARYACAAPGLLLLTGAADAPCGTLVDVELPAQPRRDARSGALIV